MFTGLIFHMVSVVATSGDQRGLTLVLEKPPKFRETRDGDSIAVNGVCLTLKAHDATTLSFDIVPETLARSNLGALAGGELVNIELSLRLGDEIGGHIVYGHVDTTCKILGKDSEGLGVRMWCVRPPALRSCIVEKGYVSLDGVSLTVADANEDSFAVALIPETLKRTTLGRKGVGLSLNIEVDPIARYVAAALEDRAMAPRLREHRG